MSTKKSPEGRVYKCTKCGVPKRGHVCSCDKRNMPPIVPAALCLPVPMMAAAQATTTTTTTAATSPPPKKKAGKKKSAATSAAGDNNINNNPLPVAAAATFHPFSMMDPFAFLPAVPATNAAGEDTGSSPAKKKAAQPTTKSPGQSDSAATAHPVPVPFVPPFPMMNPIAWRSPYAAAQQTATDNGASSNKKRAADATKNDSSSKRARTATKSPAKKKKETKPSASEKNSPANEQEQAKKPAAKKAPPPKKAPQSPTDPSAGASGSASNRKATPTGKAEEADESPPKAAGAALPPAAADETKPSTSRWAEGSRWSHAVDQISKETGKVLETFSSLRKAAVVAKSDHKYLAKIMKEKGQFEKGDFVWKYSAVAVERKSSRKKAKKRSHDDVEGEDEASALLRLSSSQSPKRRKKDEEAWQQRFKELVAYKDQYGNCNVPRGWPINPTLAGWVDYQRTDKKRLDEEVMGLRQGKGRKSSLTFDRVKALDDIGFSWTRNKVKSKPPPPPPPPPAATAEKKQQAWRQRFSELVAFKNANQHCNVPRGYAANKKLAAWVDYTRTQKKLYGQGKKSSLTPDRVKALENLGFKWSLRAAQAPVKVSWEERLAELAQYKNTHGHCNVPEKTSPSLGVWVKNQRAQKRLLNEGKKSRLTPDRVRALDELGFQWNIAVYSEGRDQTGRFVKGNSLKSKPRDGSSGGDVVGDLVLAGAQGTVQPV